MNITIQRMGGIGLAFMVVLILGILGGTLLGSTLVPPIETTKVITVEVEKPIITEKIVEVIKEVEVYRFIDKDQPVHKWIDPDNQAVVYIYPEGYTGEIWPMYTLVPPVWFDQMLRMILDMNEGFMPPEIINSVPNEWMEAVAPGSINFDSTN